jgi:hypothetical protein
VAICVRVEDGPLTDLTAVLGQDVTTHEVSNAFAWASVRGPLKSILRHTADLAGLVGGSGKAGPLGLKTRDGRANAPDRESRGGRRWGQGTRVARSRP